MDLKDHQATPEARRRAEAAGLELEQLKRDDPNTYRMLNAKPVVFVHEVLAEAAGERIYRVLPQTQVFSVPVGSYLSLLLFPPPDKEALRGLDGALGALTSEPPFQEDYVFYRTVQDPAGERRELSLPLEPSTYTGGVGFVGPFGNEAQARGWGEAHVAAALTFDSVPYGGAWFCDVFSAEG